MVLESTSLALCCRVAGCFSDVGTYLLVTELQVCRQFHQCHNLSAWHCVAGVQAAKAMSEPTCRALC